MDSITPLPFPANEPVLSYAPGTPERDSLRAALKDIRSVEIDRIEQKIRAISEMSVSHQDPDFISSQVDSVTESMTHTEKAIREINHITGLTDEMESPPSILESDVPEVTEG